MAARLRQSKNIKGIRIHNNQEKEFKISQLADDTTLFLRTKADITKALNLIEEFGTLSGLILNRSKCQGLKLGGKEIIEDDFEEIDWESKLIKALGIYFGKDCEIAINENWERKIVKIEKIITAWFKRKLTMIGKIQIINSLIISQLTHLVTVMPLPSVFLKRIESLIYKFLWDNKQEKLKRKTISQKYENGGLNLIDISTHAKTMIISWVRKLFDDTDHQWKTIPKFILNRHFGNNLLLFKMNIDKMENFNLSLSMITSFYKTLINTWIESGGGQSNEPQSITEIGNEIIWGNKHIKHKNKLLVNKNWIKSGINIIQDILDEEGKISEKIILAKLKNKTNWISEVNIIKNSIPKKWQNILQNSDAVKYKFKEKSPKIYSKLTKAIEIEKCTNKMIYTILLRKISEQALTFSYLKRELNINKSSISKAFEFIAKELVENKIKIFKWKLLHRIIPNQDLLHKWKISATNNCKYCGEKEDYEHYFIKCPYYSSFRDNIDSLFKYLRFGKDIWILKNFLIGYKIEDKDYHPINIILSHIGYAIYRAYHISDAKSKPINTLWLFKESLGYHIIYQNYKNVKLPALIKQTAKFLKLS
ncbi:hypothetical protein FSP39_010992 [Pinctada imbricata]|uniref:Reverse transcriptase zinc-binding domain-containing protein n=2 Tax=Pinctada imbricata TaxID=66713 RepID=A0AA88Y609_PINIB|nr:hypothetical protein FSP39_010992 [Pinctada imbricata]